MSSLEDILVLSSKLYDIVLVWTDSCRWCGNSRCCRRFSISGAAQPLESHRFSGDEKTRLQTWHLHSSGPTSALIFSGNARRCLRSCSYAGAAEFCHGPQKRKEWKMKLIVENVKHSYFVRWLQWFLSNPHVKVKDYIVLLHVGVAGLAMCCKGSATWATSLNHVKTTPQTQLLMFTMCAVCIVIIPADVVRV